jgi:3-oxoacyl-[acyl-carrier protein] reductase
MTDEQSDARVIPAPFADRVAIVTGASSGVGAATAELLAAQGAAVVVNHRDSADRAREIVATITKNGGRAIAIQADVRDGARVRAMVEEAESTLGPIDVLVANATGLSERDVKFAPFTQLSLEDVTGPVTTQYAAFYHPAQAVLPGMIERHRGAIVVLGAASSRRISSPGFGVVAAAKAALEASIRVLAAEVGQHGVRVNGVAPGLVLSPPGLNRPEQARAAIAQRSALKRNGTPEEIAQIIAFLASDAAAYLTGSYVFADGGTTMA